MKGQGFLTKIQGKVLTWMFDPLSCSVQNLILTNFYPEPVSTVT